MTNTINNSICKPESKSFNHLPGGFVNHKISPAFQSRKPWISNKAMTNIKSLKDSFMIEMAIPGFNKENVQITLDNSTLKIAGRKDEVVDKLILREFQLDCFERTFLLPDNVDDSTLVASIENGILTVTIQVIPAKQAQTITIN
jgi:HSP20 family molecular chaperone IbpA